MLLLFGGAPKEAIHLFADHKDTVHTVHKDGELSFESEHHHCDFLDYALPLFVATEPVAIQFQPKCVFPAAHTEYAEHICYKDVVAAISRGPPSYTV